MKRYGSVRYKAKKISLEKAIDLQELDLINNIFYQDAKGDRYGGFKRLDDVLGKGQVFLSAKDSSLYELKN
jgi:hypothetical protein